MYPALQGMGPAVMPFSGPFSFLRFRSAALLARIVGRRPLGLAFRGNCHKGLLVGWSGHAAVTALTASRTRSRMDAKFNGSYRPQPRASLRYTRERKTVKCRAQIMTL